MNLADPQQWNAYTYANNNPTTTSDPTGQCATADGPGTCLPSTTGGGSSTTTSGSTTCSDINKYSASCGGGGVMSTTTTTTSGGGGCRGSVTACESHVTPEQIQQGRWLAEYIMAIDDLPGRYRANDVLSDPTMAESLGGEIVGAMVDKRFCERVGTEECAAAFESVAASIFVVTVAPLEFSDLDKADESAKLVEGATRRQLAGGWSKIIDKNLTDEEMRAYQNELAKGNYAGARRFLGTGLHRAVATDLELIYRGRFEYTSNRYPDLLDRRTGVRVELTTVRGYAGHLARGLLYRRAAFVLYRGPGRLPPGIMRGGGER